MNSVHKTPKIFAVDLFCGAGGLTWGLNSAGIKVVAGIDLDPHCKFPFEHNNKAKFLLKDVATLSGKELAKLYPPGTIKLLAGCAPCQPFSTLANGRTAEESGEKWGLLEEFARLVAELQPELVTMENVPRVSNHTPYKTFITTLKSLGYHIDAQRLKCADYGLPQIRRRFVLIASKLGAIGLPFQKVSPPVTVRNAIAHLPPLKAGETSSKDPLHKARQLSPINLERIRASLPGGTWNDWPEEIRLHCHGKKSGSSFRSVYGRMEWDSPSPTITTQSFNFGTGRFGHPHQNRAITLREAAILQSFPDTYEFVAPGKRVHFAPIGRLIGNAVPPRLGQVVGETLVSHVQLWSQSAATT